MLTGSGSSIPMVVLTRLGDMAAMGPAVCGLRVAAIDSFTGQNMGYCWVKCCYVDCLVGQNMVLYCVNDCYYVDFIVGQAFINCSVNYCSHVDFLVGQNSVVLTCYKWGYDYVIWALEWSSVDFSLVNSCVKSAGDAPLFSTWYPGGSTMQLETYAYIRHGTIKWLCDC
ncbi:hypothetical protein R6Q59_006884 [Mikania micrantha]